jgi:hypothetical protein
VLIASPSDLEDERRAATEAVNDWNAQHAAAEAIVLLPVKWETHATPQMGVRPQEVVNRQLVSNSDLLVGMFWTKVGASTGVVSPEPLKKSTNLYAPGNLRCFIFPAVLSIPTEST